MSAPGARATLSSGPGVCPSRNITSAQPREVAPRPAPLPRPDGHPASPACRRRGRRIIVAAPSSQRQHLLRRPLQRARRGDHQPPLVVGVEQARGVVTRLVQAGAYQVRRAAVGLGWWQVNPRRRRRPLGHAAQAGIAGVKAYRCRAAGCPPPARRAPGAPGEARQRGGIRRLRQPRRGQPPPRAASASMAQRIQAGKVAQQRQRGLGNTTTGTASSQASSSTRAPGGRQRSAAAGPAPYGVRARPGRQLLQDRRQPSSTNSRAPPAPTPPQTQPTAGC